MGNTAKQCRLGLFQDSDFAGDLEDSKSTSGGTLCIFGSHTFVPTNWMCKKQTAVSESSRESEIISLDAGLRLDGILALELWDLIVSILGSVTQTSDRTALLSLKEVTNLKGRSTCWRILIVFPHTSSLRIKKLRCIWSKTMMQRPRWSDASEGGLPQWDMFWGLTELLLIGCSIESTWTPNSKSNTSTPKTNLPISWPKEISHVMSGIICCAWTSPISILLCSDTMAKRSQQDSGGERFTAKSRPMMSLIARTPSFVSSSTSVSPGKRSYGNQDPWSSFAKEDRSGRPDEGTNVFEASDHHYHEQFMESFSSASYSKLDDNRLVFSIVENGDHDVQQIGATW